MTLSSTPCSCGGENPNCFRCWGTGMVEPDLPDPPEVGAYLGSRTRRRRSQTVQAQARQLFKCPTCGVSVGKLSRHLAKVHGQQDMAGPTREDGRGGAEGVLTGTMTTSPQRLPPKKPLVPPDRHWCAVCGAIVKNLRKHISKTGHFVKPSLFDVAVDLARSNPRQAPLGFLRCPRCPAIFPNQNQLASHIIGSHGAKVLKEIGFSRSSRARRGDPEGHDASRTQQPGQFDRGPNLDAKKGWGQAFRDHGQFGSYPSHDDMDDESNA